MATKCYICYSLIMDRTITQRELRNESAAVLREVQAGENMIVTRNRHPVAGHNHGFARLYFPEHGRRLIAEFTLGNSSVHDETVAYVALCSHTLSTAEQARHAFTSHLARRGRLPLRLGHAGQPLHLRGVQFQTFSHPGPVIGISLEEDGALPELDALLRAAQVSADVTHQVGTVFVRHNVPIEVARL